MYQHECRVIRPAVARAQVPLSSEFHRDSRYLTHILYEYLNYLDIYSERKQYNLQNYNS